MAAQRVERKRREPRSGLPLWITALLALVIGVVLGLVYAWVIDPVEFTNANPGNLAPGAQRHWVQMVADSYAVTGDVEEVRTRLQFFEPAELALLLGGLITSAEQVGDLSREQRLRQLADVVEAEPAIGAPVAAPAVEEGNPLGTLLMACGFGLLALVLFGAIAVVVTRARQGQPAPVARRRPVTSRNRATVGTPEEDEDLEGTPSLLTLPPGVDEEDEELPAGARIVDAEDEELDDLNLEDFFADRADAVEEAPHKPARKVGFAEPEAPPVEYGPALAEFVTRYNYGDDGYDMSFPIETPQTEFLGETGVGISDVVSEEAPQKATAFEIWLFDKDDIRTVTKVLLSDYAWNNEELRARLAPKGELIHIQEGDTVDLETKSLRVRARVREADYGKGGPAPNSYFDRFVVELTAQQKQ